MAKQIGFVKVRGTIGGITFYKLNGGYYARKKSSLSKERVLRDAAFAGSRRSSALFGTASKLAKIVYRRMPIKKKGHGGIGKLTAKANGLLHEGIAAADALELLLEKYVGASAQMMLERAVQGKAVTMFQSKDTAEISDWHTKGFVRQLGNEGIDSYSGRQVLLDVILMD